MNEDVRLVRPSDASPTLQGLPAFVGICGRTAGATALSMNLVIVPAALSPSRTSTASSRTS